LKSVTAQFARGAAGSKNWKGLAKMKTLIMLIGLPRSGKSTYTKNLVEESRGGVAVISADTIRKILYGQCFYADGEPLMWSIRDVFLKSLMESGTDIVIDETNINYKNRGKAIGLALKHGYEVDAVWIETPVKICEERAMDTAQSELIPVINRMATQFQRPMPAEGFRSIVRVDPSGSEVWLHSTPWEGADSHD
jgi:predicted kinase